MDMPGTTVEPMLVMGAALVELDPTQRLKWRRIMRLKAGNDWLPDDSPYHRMWMLRWVYHAPIGDLWHRDESLWLEILERTCDSGQVLVYNYIEQEYQGLRFTLASVNEMD